MADNLEFMDRMDGPGGPISGTVVPFLALRGLSVFPDMILSFDVERPQSIAALESALEGDREIFLTAQKDVSEENPDQDGLYPVGTMCILRQYIRTKSGMRVMMEGKYRARLLTLDKTGKCQKACVLPLPASDVPITARVEALLREVIGLYEEYLGASGNASPETILSLALRNDPAYVADYVAQNMHLRHEEKQQALETLDPVRRLTVVARFLTRENEVLSIERDINDKLRSQLGQLQRENVLREQMRVIQAELGEEGDEEINSYRERIRELHLKEEIEKKLLKEVDRLAKQPFGSAEGSVLRGYLDVCLELPWNKKTKERLSVEAARKILDEDHYGLEKVKERICEFLAVRQLKPDVGGSILCLVGPPGTGKTSVAISIARALNRKLARMSLGGVHDEAEIRGHRKTYIGAMPGRIMSAVNQAGTMNPLILLDEIDKLASDYRGDPASALLEALDPEQNVTFRDHYLEIPFDLSDVLFITTANTTDTIPRPLLDRMELIQLTSYTDEEKLHIAKEHLLPRQRKKHGLTARQLRMSDKVIRDLIAGYTRESGVRQLEREIAAVCRKIAVQLATGEIKSFTLRSEALEGYLGVRKYHASVLGQTDTVGLVQGLAWTAAGGEILEAEAISLEGTGKLELTGNLGDVMKESAHAALTYIRSRAEMLGIDPEFYKKRDLHIHFPEGAVPKDGPSAGITIAIALISALTGCPVRRDVAMTGEITLTGRILPIGGLKEKTMAALRAGIRTVIIPAENRRDLEEIDQDVRQALEFVVVSHVDGALSTAIDFSSRERNLPIPELIGDLTRRSGGEAGIRQ